jgi:hypothetical protein
MKVLLAQPVMRCVQHSAALLAALLLITLQARNAQASVCFDDADLTQLKSASHSAPGMLVYVWSPRMAYSLHNMAAARQAAAAAGLEFVVLHDSRVPSDELNQAHSALLMHEFRQSNWLSLPEQHKFQKQVLATTPPLASLVQTSRPLCAQQLIQLEALRHFPTAFVIGAGLVHTHPIVGAMPQTAWQLSITQRMQP